VLIEANAYLEAHHRIETWFPDIPVDYHFDIRSKPEHIARASNLAPPGDFICCFAANQGTINSWSAGVPPDKVAWNHHHWVEFMRLFRDQIADIPFVIIGAPWDRLVADAIAAGALAHKVKVINLCSQLHIGETLHVMSLAKYGVYFPSGMGVLAQVICAPSTMFYANVPPHHGLIGSWADPELIANGSFKETVFMPPATFVEWLKNGYGFQNR
jgi:hypothetical protein